MDLSQPCYYTWLALFPKQKKCIHSYTLPCWSLAKKSIYPYIPPAILPSILSIHPCIPSRMHVALAKIVLCPFQVSIAKPFRRAFFFFVCFVYLSLGIPDSPESLTSSAFAATVYLLDSLSPLYEKHMQR